MRRVNDIYPTFARRATAIATRFARGIFRATLWVRQIILRLGAFIGAFLEWVALELELLAERIRLPGDTPGSRLRNFLSLIALCLSVVVVIDIATFGDPRTMAWNGPVGDFASAVLVTFSLVFFLFVVIGVVFLHDADYPISGPRLARDALLSTALTVVSFASFFRWTGVTTGYESHPSPQCFADGRACVCDASGWDLVYFSMVTFSTLGFGDFTPCPGSSRLAAGTLAIVGNLHLGLVVGAAFYLLQPDSRPKPSRSDRSERR